MDGPARPEPAPRTRNNVRYATAGPAPADPRTSNGAGIYSAFRLRGPALRRSRYVRYERLRDLSRPGMIRAAGLVTKVGFV